MTAEEILRLIVTAVGAGVLTKAAEPLLALLTSRQQGRKTDAEAAKLRAEAGKISSESMETPFSQATALIQNLIRRIEVLEKTQDEERDERFRLQELLAECQRERARLMTVAGRREMSKEPRR